MLRNVLGVIVGYLVAGLIVFGLLTGAFVALGPNLAFKPGSYEVSILWLVIWFLVTLGAGIAAGYVCALISRSRTGPRVLAALIFVLGILSAAFTPPQTDVPDARAENVSSMEAMMKAESPPWVGVANPLLGVLGVFIGARLIQRRLSAATPVVEESTIPDTD